MLQGRPFVGAPFSFRSQQRVKSASADQYVATLSTSISLDPTSRHAVKYLATQSTRSGDTRKMYSFVRRSTDVRRFIIITGLLLWCSFLIAFRVERSGSRYFTFLVWNLALAGIPLVVSTALRASVRLRLPAVLQIGCLGLWLLFLPNAPYILTDLQHLSARSIVPVWYDVAMLISCSGTGLLLGYLSLIDVHAIVARHFGPSYGWSLAVLSLALTGFAIYLGRFLRWNSWDLLTSPQRLLNIADGLLHPIDHIQTLAVTVVFGTMLVLGYIAIRVVLAPSRSNEAS